MKTFGTVLAVAVVIATVGYGVTSSAMATFPPTTQYVALGDSFVEGRGAPVPAETGYVAQVESRYFHSAYPGSDDAVNVAFDQNDTTTGTLISGGQLDSAVIAIGDPDTETKLVSVTVGGNDLLGLLRSAPCSTDPTGLACQDAVAAAISGAAANYPVILGTLAGAIAAEPSGADVVVTTYYNPFDGTGSPYETPVEFALMGFDGVMDCAAAGSNPLNGGLNDVIACTVGAFGMQVVDLHSLFEGRTLELTNIAENDVHPNMEGHRVIADAVIASVS